VSETNGWTWAARVKPHIFQWTRVCFNRAADKTSLVPGLFRQLNPRHQVRGADVTWRIVLESAGPGYFLAGDAATVLDPLSSHGVLKSLMTGIMIGHVIRRLLMGYFTEKDAIQGYRDWIRGWFNSDIQKLTQFYRELSPEFVIREL
jgi:hypothetical protein